MQSPALQVPTPSYFADEEFAMFMDSVAKFLDAHAPQSKLDQWRRDGVVPRCSERSDLASTN